ncbi:MAG: hypothetical protein ABI273_10065 [Lacunisphaera sp.]
MNKVLIANLFLFVVSCCLPALEFKNSNSPNDVMFGLRALAVGWSGLFAWIFTWFANPAWLLGVIFMSRRKPTPAVIFAVVAIALAGTTFSVIGRELPADEGGVTKMTVIKLLPGCYVWMASLVTLPFAVFFKRPAEHPAIASS